MAHRDQRLTSSPGVFADNPAAAWSDLQDLRVECLEEGGALIDYKGHSFAKLKWPTDKCVEPTVNLEGDGFSFRAAVDGFLNALCVELAFVGR